MKKVVWAALGFILLVGGFYVAKEAVPFIAFNRAMDKVINEALVAPVEKTVVVDASEIESFELEKGSMVGLRINHTKYAAIKTKSIIDFYKMTQASVIYLYEPSESHLPKNRLGALCFKTDGKSVCLPVIKLDSV